MTGGMPGVVAMSTVDTPPLSGMPETSAVKGIDWA